MMTFEKIISKFQIMGEIREVKPLGKGTVNHTYEIACGDQHYVLQELNHSVFRYPTDVTNNVFLITEYLRKIIEQEGRDPELETLHFIRTNAGNQMFQTEDGSYYRMYRMIYYGDVMEKPKTRQQAYEAARVMGQFQRRLRDFDSRQLSETLPYLHDTRHTMRMLLDAVRADICFRTTDCQEQIQFAMNRTDSLGKIKDAVEAGEIPLRVTHNDAGYSNVLLDRFSERGVCMIDLDTVMRGPSLLDFGEAVRVGAATVDEREKTGDVELDLDLFTGYVQGYCHEMGWILTKKERELMTYAVWLITLEKGICYLIDYLSGDRFTSDFSDERQNLYRAVNQFFLVLDIEDKWEQMDEIVRQVFQIFDKAE